MYSKHFFKIYPTKLKTFKSDLAPFGFFFDIFSTELFPIPIIAIPMRIDKITNNQATFFIKPDSNNINKLCNKLDLYLDYEVFFSNGIKNLIHYAKRKYYEIVLRELKSEIILNWFKKSLSLETNIPYLTNDFTFLILEFLKVYADILKQKLNPKNDKFRKRMFQYCDKVLTYFQNKLEANSIQIQKKNTLITEKICIKKKEKYYPRIVSIDVKNLQKNKIKKMNYVPYLIYDDIIDCFSYNKKCLHDPSYIPIDINLFFNNGIIIKGSKTRNFNIEKILKNINIESIIDNEIKNRNW